MKFFGGSNRQKSMQWGLVIPVCRKCHDRWKIDKKLRKEIQIKAKKKFNETYKEEFIKEFGKNYL